MKKVSILFTILSFTFWGNSQNLILTPVANGFENLVDIANVGDDRFFVVEQRGRIKILENGTTLATPFLNINSVVTNNLDERGLLGVAFHPDYATNGYFFVNYVDNDDKTTIARYSRDSANPNLADANSGEIILTIQQPDWNHNGGCIKFGPDGYLYIGTGDGGSGGDPWNNSQNPQALLGKMLRIDVDNGLPYTIPPGNPFVGNPDVLDEIWAIGLRNPWRFSFDRTTGDLWIGDVGQGAKEEIDFQAAASTGGENYGWKCYEGTSVYDDAGCNGTYVDPVYEVAHEGGFGGPCSITGGFVYRGTENPGLVGKYICTDYCTGDFYAIEPDGAGAWNGLELGVLEGAISTFGEDKDGELYCAALSGTIYKISEDLCIDAPAPTFTVTENVLAVTGTYNAYQWLLDAVAIPNATNATHTIDASGSYTVMVVDSNDCSLTSAATDVVFTNIASIPALETFTVTPNPFVKDVLVEIKVKAPTDLELELLDNVGRVMYTEVFMVNETLVESIDLNILSTGIYYLNLKSAKGIVVQKIVKR